MEWLQNLFSAEDGSALQLVLITLALMVGLILLVWIVRRIAGSPARKAARNRIPRLSVTDSAAVDDKRYLVLVRRDNIEHLIMIGGPSDVVVESNIVRVQPASKPGMNETVAPAPVTPPAQTPATTHEKKAEAPEPKQPSSIPTAAAAAPIAATATLAATSTSQETSASSKQEAALEEKTEADLLEANLGAALETSLPVEQPNEPMENDAKSPAIDEQVKASDDATNQPVEADLDAAISRQLDAALSPADFSVDPPMETSEVKSSGSDDDMQRLLNELSGNKRENA